MTGRWILWHWSLLAIHMLAPFTLAAEPIPLEQFTRSDELGTMKLSPDGEYLAMTTGQHGAEYLAFFNIKERKVGAGIRAPGGLEIDDFYWASPTRVIFMIAERQPGRIRPTPTGEIFAVDRDGKRQLRIYGYRAGEMSTGTNQRVRQANFASAEVVSLLDNDERNILISEMPWRLTGSTYYFNPDAKPTITRLDIFTGKEGVVARVPLAGASVIVDRQDKPRFAIGRDDSGEVSVAWRRTASDAWEAFELPGFREDTIRPRSFTPDNLSVLFTAVPENARYSALYQLDLATREVRKLAELPDTDVRQLVMDLQDRSAVGVAGYTDKTVYHWLAPADPAVKFHQALERAFPGNEVRFLSRSQDGGRAIVFVSSDVAPGEYFLFDTQTKQADMLMAARQWIDIRKMRPKQSITLKARDGLQLHGYLTKPEGDGPHPLVVLPHGGPHGIRDDWGFDWESQLFASRGYAVLQVNFRGSGGYGIDFERSGYRQWGAKMQDDVTDATHWAIEQKVAPADRICILGASYGGYAALMGAVREPKLYRCAIGYAGVYDLELMFTSGDIPNFESGRSYLERVLGTDATELRARSPAFNADKIEIPVMLIHGKEDFRADHKQATRMKAALEQQRKQVEWITLRREGHGIYDDATRLEVYESVLKFLDAHLPATPVQQRQM